MERVYISDDFEKRLSDIINDDIFDFVCDYSCGDTVPPELEAKCIAAQEALLNTLNECKAWLAKSSVLV